MWSEVRLPTRASHWLLLALAGAVVIGYVARVIDLFWIGDDAYITLRVVDNALNGYGFRWNVAERVQTYTHPLWFLLLLPSTVLTGGDEYWGVFLLTILCAAAFGLIAAFRSGGDIWRGIAAMSLAMSSRSVMDYSSSGLENVLNFFLAALFAWCFFAEDEEMPRRPLWCGVTAGLAMVNRHDMAVLYLPALLWLVIESLSSQNPVTSASRRVVVLSTGAIPLVLWTTFSVIYYGFPIPNTAYAKLAAGIDDTIMWRNAIGYLQYQFEFDPVCAWGIAVGAPLLLFFGSWRQRVIALGIGVYGLYFIRAGGDFMAGRFFTVPWVLLSLSLVRFSLPKQAISIVGAVILAASFLITPDRTPLQPGEPFENAMSEEPWIADERSAYARATGLRVALEGRLLEDDPDGPRGREVREKSKQKAVFSGRVGYLGYQVGPEFHVFDPMALGEPLAARLPSYSHKDARAGHYPRYFPARYLQATYEGTPEILSDPALREYVSHLHRATRAPLLSKHRFASLVWLQRNRLTDVVDVSRSLNPYRNSVTIDELSSEPSDHFLSSFFGQEPYFWIDGDALTIDLGKLSHRECFQLQLNNRDQYALQLFDANERPVHGIYVNWPENARMRFVTYNVPPDVARRGYRYILVVERPRHNEGAVGALIGCE